MLAGVPEPMHWDVGTGPNIQTLFQSSGAIDLTRMHWFDINPHISKNKRCQLLS